MELTNKLAPVTGGSRDIGAATAWAVVERFGRFDILVNNAGVFVTRAIDNPESNIAEFERWCGVIQREVRLR